MICTYRQLKTALENFTDEQLDMNITVLTCEEYIPVELDILYQDQSEILEKS